MLPQAGFETVTFWADGFLPLGVDSIRMIVLARKAPLDIRKEA